MKKTIALVIAIGISVSLLVISSIAAPDIATGTLTGNVIVSKGKKSENTVVYLKGVSGEYVLPEAHSVMDQKKKVFIPHLLPVQGGQVVDFRNSDAITHNVHLYWGNISRFNRSIPPGAKYEWKSPPRQTDYLVLCDVHPEMSAFVLVFNHPFFDATKVVPRSQQQEFVIENVPAGTYTLVAVRDVRGSLKKQETQVTVKGGEVTEVTIEF